MCPEEAVIDMVKSNGKDRQNQIIEQQVLVFLQNSINIFASLLIVQLQVLLV